MIGGIGSGKSSVARRLQSLRPVAVIDADQCGHQVLHLPNVQEQILERFGPTVFETDPRSHAPRGNASTDAPRHERHEPSNDVTAGLDAERQNLRSHAERGNEVNPQISRAALGRVVFGSDVAAETARRDLEAIVHPEIRSLLEHTIRELRRQANVEAIVLDAAVLLEAGWNDLCDVVVFIDTPQADRIARVQAGRGWSAEELAKREASQWPLPRKRAAADAVLDNANDVDHAARQLEQVILNLKSQI
ncbi:MAG: dephospho-CoA kinase [Planctomycetaceae bacterium]